MRGRGGQGDGRSRAKPVPRTLRTGSRKSVRSAGQLDPSVEDDGELGTIMGNDPVPLSEGTRERLAAWLSSNPLPPFEDEEIGVPHAPDPGAPDPGAPARRSWLGRTAADPARHAGSWLSRTARRSLARLPLPFGQTRPSALEADAISTSRSEIDDETAAWTEHDDRLIPDDLEGFPPEALNREQDWGSDDPDEDDDWEADSEPPREPDPDGQIGFRDPLTTKGPASEPFDLDDALENDFRDDPADPDWGSSIALPPKPIVSNIEGVPQQSSSALSNKPRSDAGAGKARTRRMGRTPDRAGLRLAIRRLRFPVGARRGAVAAAIVACASTGAVLAFLGADFREGSPAETHRIIGNAPPVGAPDVSTSTTGSRISLRETASPSGDSPGLAASPPQFTRSPLLPSATPERGALPRGTPVPPPPSIGAAQTNNTALSLVPASGRTAVPAAGQPLPPPQFESFAPGDFGSRQSLRTPEPTSPAPVAPPTPQSGGERQEPIREALPQVPDKEIVAAAEEALQTPSAPIGAVPMIPPTEDGAKRGRLGVPAIGVRFPDAAPPTIAASASDVPPDARAGGPGRNPPPPIAPRQKPPMSPSAQSALIAHAISSPAPQRGTPARSGDGAQAAALATAARMTALGPLSLNPSIEPGRERLPPIPARQADDATATDGSDGDGESSAAGPAISDAPRLLPDGRTQAVLVPIDPASEAPRPARIALVLVRLGETARATAAAIQAMPRPVGLAFSPSAPMLEEWIARARASGYEVMIDLSSTAQSVAGQSITGPTGGPLIIDSGTASSPYAAFPGTSPITSPPSSPWQPSGIGTAFSGGGAAAALAAAGRAALIFSGTTIAAADPSIRPSIPRAIDLVVDQNAVRFSIEQQLSGLEVAARQNGSAVGIARPFPITVEVLRDWMATLPGKGITLVPPSAVLPPSTPIAAADPQ